MMEVDESGWIDLRERLAGSDLDEAESHELIDRLAERLVGHFGSEVFEVHLGKDDPQRHSAHEVAAAAIAHLLPVIDPGRIGDALRGELGVPMKPPWDDSWRDDPRTASWRS